jgi:hypothetical protein
MYFLKTPKNFPSFMVKIFDPKIELPENLPRKMKIPKFKKINK